jgi:hypothetical protein
MVQTPTRSIPTAFDEARGNLLPIVRDTAFLDTFELLKMTAAQPGTEQLPPHFVSLAGSLCFGLAYDYPAAQTIFSASQFAIWYLVEESPTASELVELKKRGLAL